MANASARRSQADAVRFGGDGNGRGSELVRGVPRVLRSAVGQEDRPPIGRLEQALWRLVQILNEEGGVATDSLRYSVTIVADVFWLTDSAVWAALHERNKELC